MREEAEDAVITESVQLDIKNKQILNQQCRKYFKDESTKPVIIKAFKKLFDNEHAKLLRDLPPDIVARIVSKKVQSY